MNWISLALLAAIAAGAQSSTEKAQALNDQGNRLAQENEMASAISAYRESVDIWRSLGPSYEAHVAGTLVNLGVSVAASGNRPAAAKIYEEALVLHRRTLGNQNHRTITNMNLLATTWLMIGVRDRAEALLQETLAIEREFYPADIQTSRTLQAISNYLVRDVRPREALPLAEEALAITLKAVGEENLDAALAYTSVAEAHRCSHNFDRALPLFHKARALYEKFLGPEHPRVATLLSQEGLILMQENKLSLAGQLMVQAVTLLHKSCPDCLVELAIAENNLGLLRLKQKRYLDADSALSDAVALREKFETRPGPELADSLQSLAIARQNLHLFDDAARLNSRARQILSFR